jgi:hypothetical protein
MKMKTLLEIIGGVYSGDHILQINVSGVCGIVDGNLQVKDGKTKTVVERDFCDYGDLLIWAMSHATLDEKREGDLDALRDEYAKEAMVGFINKTSGNSHQFTRGDFEEIVDSAYALADLMVKHRGER